MANSEAASLIARAEEMIKAGDKSGVELLQQAADKIDPQTDDIELLAYASVRPAVKDKLVPRLKQLFKNFQGGPADVFGCLTVVVNLTTFPDEYSKLKNLGRDAETAEQVSERCRAVLEADFLKSLGKCTPASMKLLAKILLSLSRDQKSRGRIAAEGGIRMLIQVDDDTAAHAMAKILISINTEVYFTHSQVPVETVVDRLSKLLTSENLAAFESLMALTNIASIDADLVFKKTWSDVEPLLLADNVMVRRAAMELLCNLVHSDATVEAFMDSKAANRLHVVLALADVEDVPTRLAAGGALAVLSSYDIVCRGIEARSRGIEILLDMAQDENIGLRLRGLVTILNLNPEGVRKAGGKEILQNIPDNEQTKELVVQALARLH